MALYGYTVITGIIIWCMMACTWTAPEIMWGRGASPKRTPSPLSPHNDKKANQANHKK